METSDGQIQVMKLAKNVNLSRFEMNEHSINTAAPRDLRKRSANHFHQLILDYFLLEVLSVAMLNLQIILADMCGEAHALRGWRTEDFE